MEKNLTKEKFEIFMMLCAAGIDGNISMNELERICMQFDEKSYNEVFESWKTMTSPAWLSFFKEHKDEFLKTEEDRVAFWAGRRQAASGGLDRGGGRRAGGHRRCPRDPDRPADRR